ncbi:MAG: alpha/beta hydrolase [Rhodobacteraceae bacterium]|nr:alpha/beta hydrolase [Paracoccaceae bacterium]
MPLSPKSFTYKSSDGLQLHGQDWQPETPLDAAPAALCLAGLSRNARDFSDLATVLCEAGYRVICPDYRGRGRSQWDTNWQNYSIPIEGEDIDAAIALLDLKRFVVIGTSRGGLHAMAMATRYSKDQMVGVVLNDIGPEIEIVSLIRIGKSLGKVMCFKDINACADQLRTNLEDQFPRLEKDQWLRFAAQLGSSTKDGFALDYDPALANTFTDIDESQPWPDLWPLFAALAQIPLLILRGENSDLLSSATAQKMQQEHSNASLWTIADEGHAPLLWDSHAQGKILKFIQSVR